MKRFKTKDNQTIDTSLSPTGGSLNMEMMDANQAREIVRKMQTTTQYNKLFGDRP